MECKKFKEMLISNQTTQSIIIFLNCDKYVQDQYIKKIADIRHKDINHIDSIDTYYAIKNDIFEKDNNYMNVLTLENFESSDIGLLSVSDLIICTDKIEENTKKLFEINLIEIPSLKDWQVEDYIHAKLPNVDKEDTKWLAIACKDNIYKANLEIDKISIFPKADQRKMLKDLIKEDMIYNENEFNIFSFTTALLDRDIGKLNLINKAFERSDIEPLGVVTICYNNIKNMIAVKDPSATAQSTGMSPKQFSAVRYKSYNYNIDQLRFAFKKIANVEFMLKTGYLPENMIVDYITKTIFSI